MFYIVFFIFGYISLGLGVWIAMRHKELLINQHEKKYDDGNQYDEFWSLNQMSGPEDQNAVEETAVGNRDAPQEMANEKISSDSVAQSATESQSSGGMIEQLVGMVEDDESGELAAIVAQLQEIHDMTTEAGNNYYASEDAESFVTHDEERYATTTICRPKVGMKARNRSRNEVGTPAQ